MKSSKTKICPQCKKSFVLEKVLTNQTYCSVECRKEARYPNKNPFKRKKCSLCKFGSSGIVGGFPFCKEHFAIAKNLHKLFRGLK
jgi:hypothetical protein